MMAPIRALAAAGCASLVVTAALAAGEAPIRTSMDAASDPHAGHHADTNRTTRRSEAAYVMPDVTLVRDDGRHVSLFKELDDGRPLVLNFIYTTCTTICPLSSQVFAQFQRGLGGRHSYVHLISISIDPEQDTPAQLRSYAQQFHAQPGWDHYTGTVDSTIAVQKAFNVYRGSKMSHTPITFMRSAPGKSWLRIDGFATAGELLAESAQWTQPTLASR